jgi:PTH1 family peptidyl-tRNA hydrolase
MRLVVGLGNPGKKYERTRHNAGFWWTERLAQKIGSRFSVEAASHGRVAKLSADAWLLLPETYMNESGRAAAAVAGFYKIAPAEILVVHDELDMPPGGVKLKFGGGVAGHNGLKDIAERLGSNEFWRLRIGIGHPRDGANQQPVTDYVLHSPQPAELSAIDDAMERSLEIWPLLERGETEAAMLRLHTKSVKNE